MGGFHFGVDYYYYYYYMGLSHVTSHKKMEMMILAHTLIKNGKKFYRY